MKKKGLKSRKLEDDIKTKNKIKKRMIWFVSMISLIAIWVYWTNTHIEVNHVEIHNDKIPLAFNDTKIAVIADLHNKDWGNKLISKLEKEAPDFIVVVGDLIDSSKIEIPIAMDFINNAKTIADIYYVSGNHEAWSGQYLGLNKRLLESGVKVLDDASLNVEKNGSVISITGIMDPAFYPNLSASYEVESKINETFNDLEKKLGIYRILLSHRPELFEVYVENEFDLVISGHAHGGQFRIPFIGGLIAPNQGLFPKYTEGVYESKNTSMLVSRGLGNSIIPVRINNTPQLVFIHLKSAGQ